jgi:excisionase family DNA binding protein
MKKLPRSNIADLPCLSASASRPRLMTAKEAAERLGVKTDTLWDWCQAKRLRHRKIGRMIRIDPRDLEEFERKRTVEPR